MKVFLNNLFSKYKFNSILFRNFLIIFLVMFMILCVSCVTIYISLIRVSKNEMLSNNEINAKNMIETTCNVIDEMTSLTLNIVSDEEVKNYILAENMKMLMRDYNQTLYTKLSAYKTMTKYVHSIYVYNERINMAISNYTEDYAESYPGNEWLSVYRNNPGAKLHIEPQKLYGKYPYVLTYMAAIPGYGCVALVVDIYDIAKNANSAYKGKYTIYMAGENDNILYSNNEKSFMTKLDRTIIDGIENNDGIFKIGEDTYYGYHTQLNDQKYVVTSLINEYVERTNHTRLMLIFIMVFVFILGIMISTVLALKFFEPVSKIIRVIDEPGANEIIEGLKNNEIKYIATKILDYTDSNLELKTELDNKLAEHKQLTMMAMQMQMNPHFLNNSLNVIALQLATKIGADDEATIMLTSLTRVIQYVLNVDSIQVDFKQELGFLKSYIEFLSYRYKDLNVTWDIDASVSEYKILRVCLQPIVENAVYHGLSTLDKEKKLTISATTSGGEVIITIEDNGGGIEPEKLEELRRNIKSGEISSKHIGLKNVYNRLKIVYEDRADMKIDSEYGKYTRVTVTVPTKI